MKQICIISLMFFLASLNVLGHDIRGVLLPKEVERILSPDKKRVLLIISRAERPELWVMKVKGTEKRKLSKLKKEEGVRSAVWSPDGKLIAFVSYNLAGHSPMTTTRVWVVRYDGRGLKKITLPTPNERFSTYDPEWMTDHTLIVKAVTLAESSELKYLYSYETGKIKKINSEQKEERK